MGRPRSFDEGAALSQAAALFAEHGYEGTSVDDLVRGLGIHRGSLYAAFGSKRALYLRVLAEHVVALEGDDRARVDLTLLLRAAVERAPVDAEASALVGRGFRALQRDLPPADPEAALAAVLGRHLIRRATGSDPIQEGT